MNEQWENCTTDVIKEWIGHEDQQELHLDPLIRYGSICDAINNPVKLCKGYRWVLKGNTLTVERRKV